MRTIPTIMLSAALFGCVAPMPEDADDGFAADFAYLRPDECYPYGYRWDCAPDAPVRDRPRVYNPYTHGYEWPIGAGVPLMDGRGHVRGLVTDGSVKINYGMRKRLHGNTLVYVWAARLDTHVTASGWIPESAVRHRRTLRRRMRTLRLKNPGRGHYRARWRVTGGDNARYEDLTVTRGWSGGGRRATDYLLRPGDVVNLIYDIPGHELGGYNVDTFAPGVTFRRARGVRQLRVPLYRLGGTTSVANLHFVYGFIHDGDQRRYGWMAKEALERDDGSSDADDVASCSARCCDGHLATGLESESARACIHASSDACDGHGYVRRARMDGELVYRRHRYCWARCDGDASYDRLDGVTHDCTLRAIEHCGGRGLDDAAWDPCAP